MTKRAALSDDSDFEYNYGEYFVAKTKNVEKKVGENDDDKPVIILGKEKDFVVKKVVYQSKEYYDDDEGSSMYDYEESSESEDENEPKDESGGEEKSEEEQQDLDEMSMDLNVALKAISSFGSFATSNTFTVFPQPSIVLNINRHHIGLPLSEEGLAKLKEVCEQAPFGRGKETVVDTSFRNCWQIGPDGFDITSPLWDGFLDEIKPKLKRDLGIGSGADVKLELYKLLAYETGCFFKAHKDTIKTEKMIGTVVMVLPSVFEGGQLIVSLNGEEKVFDFSKDGAHYIQYAAFYADCLHEVKPITSGARTCLVYNIIMDGNEQDAPSADMKASVETIATAIENLKKVTKTKKNGFVFLLEHDYTNRSLCLDLLKRKDYSVVNVLNAAVKEVPGARICLAQLEIYNKTEQGDNASREDDERSITLRKFANLDGHPVDSEFAASIVKRLTFESLYPRRLARNLTYYEKWDGEVGNGAVWQEEFYCGAVVILNFQI